MDNQLILSLINKNITDSTLQFSYMAIQNNSIKEYCIKKGIYKAINEYLDMHKPTIYDIHNCNYEYFENILFNSNENALTPSR